MPMEGREEVLVTSIFLEFEWICEGSAKGGNKCENERERQDFDKTKATRKQQRRCRGTRR